VPITTKLETEECQVGDRTFDYPKSPEKIGKIAYTPIAENGNIGLRYRQQPLSKIPNSS
jgi:hypothetical protein